jgi:hypothetical protein
VNLFARLYAWFVVSLDAPDLLPSEVDVKFDEEDLFEEPTHSTMRLKVGGIATRSFEPSGELLEATRDEDDEPTRRVDLRELKERLAASDRRRR